MVDVALKPSSHACVGVIGESVIVDIDHWRHYFLILGVLWGLMAASNRCVAAAPSGGIVRDAVA
jgi:hypothetical protein